MVGSGIEKDGVLVTIWWLEIAEFGAEFLKERMC